MIMADTLAIFLVVVGFLLALPGLWLLCRGLWPEAVTATAEDCRRGLLFPFLVGLPITVAAFFTTVAASKALGPASGFASVGVVCLFVIFASVGIAGLTTSIGAKLPSPADIDRPWQATIRGSVVLELAFLLPILGWFVILPSALIIGSGSACRMLVKKLGGGRGKNKTATAAAAEERAPAADIAASSLALDGSLGTA
jgi:hypothetical protein